MVPYERNEFFTGRDSFLEILYEKFWVNNGNSSRYHGRIALFGMGGIGKTQTVLEFVHRYQTAYGRIYWISAGTQDSLLNGYAKIGKLAELVFAPDSKPIEVAEKVLLWLKKTPNWLLVVDNLDDTNVLSTPPLGEHNMLLPDSGPGHHTLITTRNKHADHIPAQTVEVPLFEEFEAIALLASLSGLPLDPNSAENEFAHKIVKELGCLPLAISQAAAYIKQVSGSFAKFVEHYTAFRSQLNAWVPDGPRPYPYSVATTWVMSLDEIRKNNPIAVQLFRLLAFLNPDNILIDFLKSGVAGLDHDLQRLLSDEFEFSNALLSFETFSLVKWNRQRSSISLHRLVQAVVKDEMSIDELIYFRGMINAVCDQAIPNDFQDRVRFRLYIGQVMGTLLDPELLESEIAAHALCYAGSFLREDGNNTDGEVLLLRSCKILEELLGCDHNCTLVAQHQLAWTYWAQAKMAEAARLQEEVLEKRKKILGEDHPETLRTMHNLLHTYWWEERLEEANKLEEEFREGVRRGKAPYDVAEQYK